MLAAVLEGGIEGPEHHTTDYALEVLYAMNTADINEVSNSGMFVEAGITALHLACACQSPEVVRAILAREDFKYANLEGVPHPHHHKLSFAPVRGSLAQLYTV